MTTLAVRRPHIIAFANQKGGAGKTSTTANFAAYLSYLGCRILVIDLDPQANMTTALGATVDDDTLTTSDLLSKMNKGLIGEVIIKSGWDLVDFVPSSVDLAMRELDGAVDVPFRLKASIEGADLGEYDFILIDCPPNLGRMLQNALFVADDLILITDATSFGLKGIVNTLDSVGFAKDQVNPKLTVRGIVLNKFDGQEAEQVYRADELRQAFGTLGEGDGLVAKTVIPKRAAIASAVGNGTSIFEVKSNSGAFAAQTAIKDVAQDLGVTELATAALKEQ